MSYRAVVAVPGVPRMLASSVLGRLPLGTSTLALLLFVHDRAGSFALAGVVVAAFTFAGAAAAPLLGKLVDRLGAARVLLPAAAAHALALVLLTVATTGGAPAAALVAIAALGGAVVPPISSCARALWPSLTPDAAVREAGYAIDAVAQELIWTLGPLLVALVVALWEPAAAVLLSAALTLAGTLLFVSSPLVRAWRAVPTEVRPRVLGAPGMPRVLVCIAIVGFGLGASEVGFPAVALEIGSPGAAGVLLALLSVGSAAGGLWYGQRRWSGSLELRHGRLLLVLAVLSLGMLAARSLPAAIPLSLLAGLAWAPVLSCQYALVAQLAPRGAETTAFTWSTAAIVAGIALGAAVAGPVADATSGHVPFLLASAGYAAGGALALVERPHRFARA